jgi:hypothetical protein
MRNVAQRLYEQLLAMELTREEAEFLIGVLKTRIR